MAAQTGKTIAIPPINKQIFTITIIGDTPLLSHRKSEEMIDDVEDKQTGKSTRTKTRKPKDPEAEYKQSIYNAEDGEPGFPASGIKKACVDACTYLTTTKVWARGAFYILGDILKIKGKHRMRRDVVRIGRGTMDLRYRAEYPTWEITFDVLHNPDVISTEEIINLLENAGFYIGIGDWRPQTNGTFGMFKVKTS